MKVLIFPHRFSRKCRIYKKLLKTHLQTYDLNDFYKVFIFAAFPLALQQLFWLIERTILPNCKLYAIVLQFCLFFRVPTESTAPKNSRRIFRFAVAACTNSKMPCQKNAAALQQNSRKCAAHTNFSKGVFQTAAPRTKTTAK